MGRSGRFIRFFAPLAMIVLVAGCGSEEVKPPPTIVDASFVAARNLNPDPTGRSSPVVVRFYELSATSLFNGADFFALYDQDETLLARDLQARDEFKLKPGGQQVIEREVQPQTRFLAVLAAFRDIEKARWRAAVPVAPNSTNRVVIRLEGLQVDLLPQ